MTKHEMNLTMQRTKKSTPYIEVENALQLLHANYRPNEIMFMEKIVYLDTNYMY